MDEEVQPTGTCFEDAGRHLMKSNHGGDLVHGTCTLPDGKVVKNHAWVDEGKQQGIFEPEHAAHLSHNDFQSIFQPTEFKRYNSDTMMKNMLKHNHWGPWED